MSVLERSAQCRFRHRDRFQGYCKYLVDRCHDVEMHPVPHFGGHVLEIVLIALRHDHVGQSGGMRSQHFLFEAANRQRPSLQRHFTGHPDRALHGSVRQQRHGNPLAQRALRPPRKASQIESQHYHFDRFFTGRTRWCDGKLLKTQTKRSWTFDCPLLKASREWTLGTRSSHEHGALGNR